MTLTAGKIIETAMQHLGEDPVLIAEAKKGFQIMIDDKMNINYVRTPGCYPDLTNEEYHADKSSISRSALMDFMKSPYNYFWNHEINDKPSKEETDAMVFGSAFHTIVLEWPEFYNRYAIEPTKVLLKDVGREKYDEYKSQCEELEKSEKIILSEETFKKLSAMKVALYHNNKISNLLIGGVNESSYFWKDEQTGFLLKCRPDILHENIIVDLKTCADASPRAFQSAMIAGGYHIQGAMIRDGVRAITGRDIPNFICVAIEKTYPYTTGIYIIDEFALEVGQEKYKQALLDLRAAKESNSFPDYGVQTIGLPKWAI